MSKINKAIDLIAIYAEEKEYQSLILDYLSQGTDKTTIEEFSDKEIASITPKNKPRLSKEEIDGILEEYPFKLSLEIYELFQRGNGSGLPIGLNRNYDTYINYFMFPLSGANWNSLEYSMRLYKSIKDYEELDDKLFPLFSSELCLYATKGTEKQTDVSPIFFIYQDNIPLIPSLGASSLTGIMLACAERMEKGHANVSTEYLMNKYEIYDEILIAELT